MDQFDVRLLMTKVEKVSDVAFIFIMKSNTKNYEDVPINYFSSCSINSSVFRNLKTSIH